MYRVVLFLLMISVMVSCEKGGAVKAPVNNFYQIMMESDAYGFPDDRLNKKIKPCLSDNLSQALKNKENSSNSELDKIFLFASSRQIPDSMVIGDVLFTTNQARISVQFMVWKGQDTLRWIDQLRLTQVSGDWKIEDIYFEKKSGLKTLLELLEKY